MTSPTKEKRMNILQKVRRGSRRLPGLVAIMLVAGIILTPAIGEAAAFLTRAKADKRYLQNTSTVRVTTIVPPSSFTTQTATCPSGFQAIGGGAESPVFASQADPRGFVMLESKPVGGPRPTGWYVEAANLFGTDPLELSVVAVCSK
jgi:hypothetical protein